MKFAFFFFSWITLKMWTTWEERTSHLRVLGLREVTAKGKLLNTRKNRSEVLIQPLTPQLWVLCLPLPAIWFHNMATMWPLGRFLPLSGLTFLPFLHPRLCLLTLLLPKHTVSFQWTPTHPSRSRFKGFTSLQRFTFLPTSDHICSWDGEAVS